MRASADEAARFKAFEAEGWSARAPTYGRLTGRLTERVIPALLDGAGAAAGTRVLDVATGPGRLAAAAADRGGRVTAVDAAPEMVAAARRANPGIRVLLADAEELPFEPASFDAVVAGFVLNHLPRPERAAAGFARVLAPGGRVAAAVWDAPERMKLFGLIAEAMTAAGADTSLGVPDGPDPYAFADDGRFGGLLAAAGFEAVEVRAVGFEHRAGSVDELWEGLLGGSVRSTARLHAQPERVRRRARAAFDALAAELRDRDGSIRVPVAVKLATGRRP